MYSIVASSGKSPKQTRPAYPCSLVLLSETGLVQSYRSIAAAHHLVSLNWNPHTRRLEGQGQVTGHWLHALVLAVCKRIFILKSSDSYISICSTRTSPSSLIIRTLYPQITEHVLPAHGALGTIILWHSVVIHSMTPVAYTYDEVSSDLRDGASGVSGISK